ncbi:MAG TPA: 2-dehydropantoate 2-reductase [Hyphomicrobiaceae bacterium]|nr:2-dehydropantoate 2-reductase [Hyphomicrobiaceae bacterium]
MKIAVMGAGALGCYFGGRLAAAGYDVSFIARGATLKALRRDGVRIESTLGNLHLLNVRATSDPGEIGPVDVVMFLVKLYDTETAARAIAPLLGRDTAILTLQNGVDAAALIGGIAGRERVIGGTAFIAAENRAPGLVAHHSAFARVRFGEFDRSISPRVITLEQAFIRAQVDAKAVDDIEVQLWEKFVFLSALSGMTSLTRLPLGPILADELSASLFRRALEETNEVGRKLCHRVPADVAERQLGFARAAPPTMRSSMLDDLERGRRLELDHLSGAVARLGRAVGVETPVHTTIHAALHPLVNGRL